MNRFTRLTTLGFIAVFFALSSTSAHACSRESGGSASSGGSSSPGAPIAATSSNGASAGRGVAGGVRVLPTLGSRDAGLSSDIFRLSTDQGSGASKPAPQQQQRGWSSSF